MSKTSEKNSIWVTANRYWKQFVASVIDLRNRYVADIFFRTEFNVILLQIVFATLLSVLVAVAFNYLYRDILETVLNGIMENIRHNGTFTSSDILNSIQVVRAKNFLAFFSVTVSITILFSYIIARMTLIPARNALTSQKRFVSDIAHELRTPLAVIKTNTEVALLDDSYDDRVRKMFRSNIEELDRVSSIINNLLTFNTLVQPEEIRFSTIDISAAARTAIDKLDELQKKREVTVSLRVTQPATIRGNMIALEQIIINLVKNAINYNVPQGTVTITIAPDYTGHVVLSVEDTGIGISPRDIPHIFDPFFRVEKSRSRALGSSGLGLTIVKELVKLHSGTIRIKSKVKEGTTFILSFPYVEKEEEPSQGSLV